ncbi:MAG: tRNA (guanosine(46)-N7)-methyltransferase TrmB [Bacteroidales bacterium]|jgi:tRNA (guanine-N7-)-methyltransferase|nr:tRNA (guanosine(46)-N7)-methyltransferase TrmB [Bacteroidales bacterium]
MGKNKWARWSELNSFANVIQPEISGIVGTDHPVKGNWRTTVFKNSAPIVLELGCGKGEYTVSLAEMFPKNNFTGVDIKGARMWRGAKTSNERSMTNVAFLRTRIEFIDRFFSEGEADEIWITFPDPHTGTRNTNKRLTSPWYLAKYASFLKRGGIIHLKTDSAELFHYTRTIIKTCRHEELFASDNLYSAELKHNDVIIGLSGSLNIPTETQLFVNNILSIKTFYEKQFLAKGMKITYLAFRLNNDSIAEHAGEKA